MQGCFAVQISQTFLCFSERTTRCIFDYSSSLLSAHLSNLSGVKMFKHMLTVKHSSIKTHPNQLLEVFHGTVLAGAWSPSPFTGVNYDFGFFFFCDILSISMFIGHLGGTSSISELEKGLRKPTRHQITSWVKKD